MKVIVKNPTFNNHWVNNIEITRVKIDTLKNRNNRKEIKLYGKNNRFEYEVLMWFREDYFINGGMIKRVKAKRGLGYRLVYSDDGYFDIYLSVKTSIPELKEIHDKNEYYVINQRKSNKVLGVTVKMKISNKDLRNIHPYLEIPRPEKMHKDIYKHKKFYYGGSCSPR